MKFTLNLKKKYDMIHYEIRKLKLFGYHGVYETEKDNGQFFFINISFDSSNNIKNDNINSAVDYTAVCSTVKQTFNNKRYNLMETLLNNIRNDLNNKFCISNLSVSIQKENLNIDNEVQSINIKI